jgi:3-oxoacyl-[acyl-carrier protein] reductase
MLMSLIDAARTQPFYPELAGRRVLVTGVTSRCGVDIVRAFAEHRARLVVQFGEDSEQAQVIAEVAAPAALEMRAFGPVPPDAQVVTGFARQAVQAFGGLDAVINLVPLSLANLDSSATTADVEQIVGARLLLPCLISRVAANRMALALIEGLILNIATLVPPPEPRARAFAAVVKSALAAMTRTEAEAWAGKAIRFKAIAPQTAQVPPEPSLAGEAQVAALALFLASGRGKALSGHVFEAEPTR